MLAFRTVSVIGDAASTDEDERPPARKADSAEGLNMLFRFERTVVPIVVMGVGGGRAFTVGSVDFDEPEERRRVRQMATTAMMAIRTTPPATAPPIKAALGEEEVDALEAADATEVDADVVDV
ncbi:hypothetical protein HK101_006959 [Irineochytrium annulatum]|nr:hypothetical protein HK101_006959 [Irineochytrium annulatum]